LSANVSVALPAKKPSCSISGSLPGVMKVSLEV
jgi:hypothetical protein